MERLTEKLWNASFNSPDAVSKILPLVYDELRSLAAKKLSNEKPGQTLQATALVHEAYMKLVKVERWESRRHFLSAAAEAMRQILIDQARRKAAQKRGGQLSRKQLDFCDLYAPEKPEELLALDAAIEDLAKTNKNAASIVKLRFYVGLTNTEAAEAMGISPRTADRTWSVARAWLAVQLGVDEA